MLSATPAAVPKRLLAKALQLFGLEGVFRRALGSWRARPIPAREVQRAAKRGATIQSLMDIAPGSRWHNPAFVARFGGFSLPGQPRTYEPCFPQDRVRSDQIVLLLRELEMRAIPGAMAELGVHRGGSARLLHHYAPARRLYLFDTFTGFSPTDLDRESVDFTYNKIADFADTSVPFVLSYIAPINANVTPVSGWFPGSITPAIERETFAFVHLDADLEEPIAAGLAFFSPRLAPGGFILVHDYNAWPGARLAVDRFVAGTPGWIVVPLADKAGSALLVRTTAP